MPGDVSFASILRGTESMRLIERALAIGTVRRLATSPDDSAYL